MTTIYFVKVPTYGGKWGMKEEVRYWEIIPVPAGSDWAREWEEGWTLNDAGERVSLPFICFKFETYNDALDFIEKHQ